MFESCAGDEHLLREKLRTGNMIFQKCCHPDILQHHDAARLNPSSEILKGYHSLYNKWVPKCTHFSYLEMITGSQLAATDFNLGSKLSQAKIKSEEKGFNITCSKVTNNWSAKPIKETKDRSVLKLVV